MPCYSPLDAYRLDGRIVFTYTPDGSKLRLPCGRCIGCRLERSRQWAVRLMHELRFHERASFLTLTYSDEFLPSPPSLDVKDFQDFLKRLRKRLYPRKVRFFHCGEYGEKKGRPHYHCILFGEDFLDDSFEHMTSKSGNKMWRSKLLSETWKKGSHYVGSVTFDSCAYVARYITGKILGPQSEKYYEWILPSGEVTQLRPEYCTMSRGGRSGKGIASGHFDRFKDSIYTDDCVVFNGKRMKPPKYYDKLLDVSDSDLYKDIKFQRECARFETPELSRQQLAVKQKVKLQQISALNRSLEDET